jgi:hypothetical protein
MTLRLGQGRERIHPLNHFDHALFALALLAAGSGHVDAQGFGVIEQRSPAVAWIDCPLMVRVTAIPESFLPALRFEFGFHRFRHFARGTLALFFLAPLPLGQVVVGVLQVHAWRPRISTCAMNFHPASQVTSSDSSSALI